MPDPDTVLAAVLFRSTGTAIVALSPEFLITAWNRGAEELFGYRATETVGQPLKFLAPAGREVEEKRYAHLSTTSAPPLDLRVRRRTKAGLEIDVLISLSALHTDTGRFIGFSEIIVPFPHEVNFELAHLRTVVSGIDEGAVATDAQGRIADCNPNAARMLGYEVDDLIGTDWSNLLADLDAESGPSSGRTVARECWLQHRSGRALAVRLTSSPIRDTFGTISGSSHLLQHQSPAREDPLHARRSAAAAQIAQLTKRQREVLMLMARGHTTGAIARRLDISEKTIEMHRTKLKRRLKARHLADLLRIAALVWPDLGDY